MNVCQRVTERPFGYMVLDLHPGFALYGMYACALASQPRYHFDRTRHADNNGNHADL